MCKSIEKKYLSSKCLQHKLTNQAQISEETWTCSCFTPQQVELELLEELLHQLSVFFSRHLDILHEVCLGCVASQLHYTNCGCSLQI